MWMLRQVVITGEPVGTMGGMVPKGTNLMERILCQC
jgi:hypothetical protein